MQLQRQWLDGTSCKCSWINLRCNHIKRSLNNWEIDNLLSQIIRLKNLSSNFSLRHFPSKPTMHKTNIIFLAPHTIKHDIKENSTAMKNARQTFYRQYTFKSMKTFKIQLKQSETTFLRDFYSVEAWSYANWKERREDCVAAWNCNAIQASRRLQVRSATELGFQSRFKSWQRVFYRQRETNSTRGNSTTRLPRPGRFFRPRAGKLRAVLGSLVISVRFCRQMDN